MATQQTTGSKGKGRQANQRTAGKNGGDRSKGAVENDDTYGLISAVYHSLQGAETCGKYVEDARRAQNDELVAFFEEWRDELNRRALSGKQLLAAQLEDLQEDVEEVAGADED
jgi:hypothetical protein